MLVLCCETSRLQSPVAQSSLHSPAVQHANLGLTMAMTCVCVCLPYITIYGFAFAKQNALVQHALALHDLQAGDYDM